MKLWSIQIKNYFLKNLKTETKPRHFINKNISKMKILVINPYKKHDYLAYSIIEGLKKFKFELYYTDPSNGADNVISDDEFIEHYKTCNYIFALWGKCMYDGTPSPKYYLIEKVNGWKKTIYIDGSEYNYTGFENITNEQLHPVFKHYVRWYFKRECLINHVSQGIIPISFAAVDSYFSNWDREKDIDVFCSYGQSITGLRNQSIVACNELKQFNYNIKTNYSNEYISDIKRSFITIDAFGGGECNARMWQIMANKSCLFAQKYNIVIPNLIDGVHYVSWTDKEDLKRKIQYYLKNKNQLYKIINNSYENVIRNHRSESRIKYIFDKII